MEANLAKPAEKLAMKLTPKVTEKAYTLSTKRQYMIEVPAGASKQLIAKEVSEQFKVTVTDVKVAVRKGKAARVSRGKHRYPTTIFREDTRIAYVTLKEGDKLDIFEEKTEAKDGKEDKATEAKVVKADKKAEQTEVAAETKKAGLFVRRRTGNRGDK